MLRVFNTLTREKEDFVPVTNGKVGMYSCGPTVYNYAHIGNLRTYVFNDVLRRTIVANGYKLTHVMNITDVGHLTSDADSGEDKMLKGAKREGKTVWEVAQFYTDAFFNDTARLHLQKPEIVCKATDHIKEMIDLNQKIEKNGFAYFAGGNLYFDTAKFADYGKMAKLDLENLREGARVEADENKKNATDFALWFTKSKFKDQEMKWPSPWGEGYPGWHIECAAMSMKYLGEQFDIHSGGIDHIPVHHTNEIAEAESATGKKPWVKYWMHGEFLVIDKGKMAKSGDNFLTLQTLIDKGYDPLVYKYFCFTAHYRSKLNFSFEALDTAKNSFNSLKQKVIEIKKNKDSKGDGKRYIADFMEAVNDDLNMPQAMSFVWNVVRDNDLGAKEKYKILLEMDRILGFDFSDWKEEEVEMNSEIESLIKEREEARKKKDFKKSDEIRDKFKEMGIILQDTPNGVVWKKG